MQVEVKRQALGVHVNKDKFTHQVDFHIHHSSFNSGENHKYLNFAFSLGLKSESVGRKKFRVFSSDLHFVFLEGNFNSQPAKT